MATRILKKYIKEVTNLKRDKAHGPPSLHKPLLLLTVIELIEDGQIQENKILYSSVLRATYKKYWSKVKKGRPNDVLPFYHLTGDGFWHLHANIGKKEKLKNTPKIKTISGLNEIVAYASFDEPLFLLLTNVEHREMIRQTLISRYFSNFRPEITDIIEEQENIRTQKIEKYSTLIKDTTHPFSLYKSPKKVVSIQRETPIRSAGFRQAIMNIYDYRCAVCRLRILTKDGKSITDAAHIVPFSESYNDDVRNGISLCKSHHWAFDNRLISISETYKVIVSPTISDQELTEWMLIELDGQCVWLPEDNEQQPAQEALEWHRERFFEKEI